MPDVVLRIAGTNAEALRAVEQFVAGLRDVRVEQEKTVASGRAAAASIAEQARLAVDAQVKQIETNKLLSKSYGDIALAAKTGSEEQVVAARLARDAWVKAQEQIAASAVSTGRVVREQAAESARATTASREERGFLSGATGGNIGRGGRALSFASTAFLGGAAVGLEVRSAIDAVKAYQDSLVQLQQAVRNTGQSWSEQRRELVENVDKMERLGFAGTDVRESLTRLVVATGSSSKAIRDEALAADISRARHTDLGTATQILARIEAGRAAGLSRFGIQTQQVTTYEDKLKEAHIKVTDANRGAVLQLEKQAKSLDLSATRTAALQEVTRRFASAAEQHMHTASGATDALRVEIEKFQVVLGRALLPAITNVANELTKWITRAERSGKLQQDVNTFVRDGTVFVHDLRDAIHALWPFVDGIAHAMGGWKNVIEAIIAFKLAGYVLGLLSPMGRVTTALLGEGGLVAGLSKAKVGIGELDAAAAAEAGAGGGLAALAGRAGGLIGILTRLSGVAAGVFALGQSGEVMNPSQRKQIGLLTSTAGYQDLGGGYVRSPAGRYFTVDAHGNLHAASGPPPTSTVGGINLGSTGQPGQAGAGGVQIPMSIRPTHQTAGLAGFPAVDIMATPGTPIRAPENGMVTRISGHEPTEPPPQGQGGPWGLSLYFLGTQSGNTYYMTHLVKVAPVGGYKKGDVIGIIGNYPGGPDHVHLGIHRGDSSEAHVGSGLFNPADYLTTATGSTRGTTTQPPPTDTTTTPSAASDMQAFLTALRAADAAGASGTTRRRRRASVTSGARLLPESDRRAIERATQDVADAARSGDTSTIVASLRAEREALLHAEADLRQKLHTGSTRQQAAVRDELATIEARVRGVNSEITKALVVTGDALLPRGLRDALTRLQSEQRRLQAFAQFQIPGDVTNYVTEISKNLASQEQTLRDEVTALRTRLGRANIYQRAAIRSEITKVNQQLQALQSSIDSNLHDQASQLQSAVSDVQSRVQTIFGRIANEIIGEFEAQTQAYEQDVLAPRYFQGGAQTPSERALAQMQVEDARLQQQQQLADAEKALSDARQSGDAAQIAAAQKALDQTNRQIAEDELAAKATEERAKADADYAAAVKQYERERSVEESKLKIALDALGVAAANGVDIQGQLNDLLAQYGIPNLASLSDEFGQMYASDLPQLTSAMGDLYAAIQALVAFINSQLGGGGGGGAPWAGGWPGSTDPNFWPVGGGGIGGGGPIPAQHGGVLLGSRRRIGPEDTMIALHHGEGVFSHSMLAQLVDAATRGGGRGGGTTIVNATVYGATQREVGAALERLVTPMQGRVASYPAPR